MLSYNAESLFNNIAIQETINYILVAVYVEKELPKICSKLTFKGLNGRLHINW